MRRLHPEPMGSERWQLQQMSEEGAKPAQEGPVRKGHNKWTTSRDAREGNALRAGDLMGEFNPRQSV